MREEVLPGGNTTGAVLIDGVVHKRVSRWTTTVHALLRHLEDAGFDAAPRALGFDEQGREMLSYLPGETIGGREPWPDWASDDAMLVLVGRWLRRVHDLTADFPPPPDECWFVGRAMGPGLVVGHQDASPYNAVVDGDRLVGFCDWDTAGPSSRGLGPGVLRADLGAAGVTARRQPVGRRRPARAGPPAASAARRVRLRGRPGWVRRRRSGPGGRRT